MIFNYNINLRLVFFSLIILNFSCCPTKLDKHEKLRIDQAFKENLHFTQSNAIKAKIIEIPEIEGKVAIFPNNCSESLFRAEGEKTFTPTINDISDAEAKLKIKFQNKNDDFRKNFDGKTYNRRQYIGIYDKEGNKKLLINLFLIETKCQSKGNKNYSFDKVFIESNHSDNPERFEEVML